MKYRELQNKTDDELIELYDKSAERTQSVPSHYLDVLNRRHQERLTKQIRWMTCAITVATFLYLSVAIFDVFLK